jgi:hypothetical protein
MANVQQIQYCNDCFLGIMSVLLKDRLFNKHFYSQVLRCLSNAVCNPQSSSTLWNYSKCGIYTVESEAAC